MKEFEIFKEWLQYEREELAKEIISLTDTETFANLQRVYEDFNTELENFNKRMAPLTDIIDAIYTLRANGATFEAFQKIQEDRAYEEKYNETKQTKESEKKNIENSIAAMESDIAALGQQRGFFGLGGVIAEAREGIVRKELDVARAKERAAAINTEIASLDAERSARQSEQGAFYKERQELRKLLDISGPQHIERQKELVDAAMSFVTTSKERIGDVRNHLSKMQGQVDQLYDTNNSMVRVYGVIDESLKDAEKSNQDIRSTFQKKNENEDKIAQIKREESLMAVEDHITMLTDAASDAVATHADLSSQTIRIRTMRDANHQQSSMARKMHSQGIAGVADRLSVVLQAVNSAALNESSQMAKDTLIRMKSNTDQIAQKESIRLAIGAQEINKDLQRALEELANYGDVQRTATDITRNAVMEMREKLELLQAEARRVQEDTNAAIAVHADVVEGTSGSRQAKQPAPVRARQFGKV